MEIRNITLDELKSATAKISARYDGNIIVHQDAHSTGARSQSCVGRLAVVSSRAPGARRSWSGRRMPAACWHAYRDVLAELFSVNPGAVIVTTMARYDGVDGFLRNYPPTADVNVGSMIAPAYMPELCDCDDPE